MKKIILLSLFFNHYFFSISQNELATLSVKATIALNNGDSLKALEYFSDLRKFTPTKPFDYLKAIKMLDSQKEFANASQFIDEVLLMGYDFESLNSKVTEEFKGSKEWEQILLRKDSLRSVYEKSLNKEWISELKKMTYIDQEIRKVYMMSFKDSIRKEKMLFAMNVVDSINFANLLEYTKIHGFPSYKTVGYMGVNDCWLLLWHHRGTEFESNPLWMEIKPFIEKEISIGNLDKDFLAMFIDHNEVENGRPMIYGSLFGYYRGQPEYDQLTVIDSENLYHRRQQLGLAPIELWLESLKLPLPAKLQ